MNAQPDVFLGVCIWVTIKYVMNKFRNKIFWDFEENLYRHLNISLSEFLQIFREHGEDPIARFDEVLKTEGPEELRLLMDVYVNGLSILYTEAELGRELSAEEMIDNARRLGLRYRLNDQILTWNIS